MRRVICPEPETCTNAPREVWDACFFRANTDGFFAGARMDFNVIVPLSRRWKDGRWKKSKLEKVRNCIPARL